MVTPAKMKESIKAIALLSGGLDSSLAAKVVKNQGIEVIGLHFTSPFGCETEVKKSAEELGIRLVLKDKGEAYLDLIQNPQYGYGKAVNPCIDCRIYMFQMAEKVMKEEGAQFIVSGEVVGQRPMSQLKNTMKLIDRKSESEKLVLRPLSAHHFPPTIAEENGWVDRDKLFNIWGRGRKDQLSLAKELGVTKFHAPGGGCLLTEVSFAERLRDFFNHPTYQNSEEKLAQSEILRHGRHFRLNEKTKIIVGRNEKENNALESLWPKTGGELFKPKNFDGPTAIAFGQMPDLDQSVGAIIARYGKGPENKEISKGLSDEAPSYFVSKSISDAELQEYRL